MDGVINISSDSDGDESDVEILGTHRNILIKDDPLPLSTVRIDVNALRVNVPTHINLTEPRWTHSGLIIGKSENSTSLTVIDLTESDIANVTEHETEKLPQDDCPIEKDCTDEIQIINKQDFSTRKRSSGDPPIFTLKQDDCSNLKPKQSSLDSQTQHQKRTNEVHHHTPTLRQLPFIETHVTELKTPKCSNHLSKDSTQISVQPRLLDSNSEEPECISNFKTTTTSNGPHMGPLLEESPPKVIESLVRQEQQVNCDFTSSQINGKISPHQLSPANFACSGKEGSVATSKEHITREDERGDVCLSIPISSPTSCSVSQDKAQASFQREDVCSNPEQLELNQAESGQIYLSEQPSTHSPTTGLNPSKAFEIDSLSHTSHMSYNLMRQSDPTSASEPTLVEKTSERQLEEFKADEASNSPDLFHGSIHSESLFSFSKAEDMDNGSRPGTFRGDLGNDSPLSILWQEWSDGDQANEESRFDMTFRVASSEDRHFVCPVTLRKIMSGPAQTLVCEEDKGFGMPEMLCRQSLSLVYSTIDEHYTEGTLQLLSDLLQPGRYPPKDITYHLLHDILLNPQCPYHLCVQAFNLLIRTQRHHMADITTVPWDWELLSLVIDNQEQIQDHTKRQRCEVVRMLFEYVVLTLEDDFQAKLSTSALHHSIAKATLSCDQQFPRVRDVIKWLFSAIKKSTEQEESKAERDEPIRMVSFLQRMLSLALEVDRSPALNSAQMSQELFLMLIGKMHLRAHRMLLLESLQSKLVRCKLLEQLLDYACPVKTHLPMSLSLLLHFMKNCTLAPDPADGTERWQRWEELVHLLWMLLLSYNKAMKGCLYSSVTEQRRRVGTLVYKQADMITKPAVCEAVEAFLSRTQADLGKALPLHVEESLTYLQDHLLDVCQC